ncbi:MAG: hypothetical protein JWO12_543 [Frankiales bacterium]|nr:hypothetical protein [Frankiales bacterium]
MPGSMTRALPGCAGLVALLVAGCSGVSGGSAKAGEDTPAPTASVAPVPVGWQVVSSLGLEVYAPGSWPFNGWSGCGPPPPALIERDQGAVAGCGSDSVVPSSLRIQGLQPPNPRSTSQPASQPSSKPASVDLGSASGSVSRGQTADGRFRATVEVPALQAEVSVESPDKKTVDAIVSSVRAVDIDGVGCPTRLGAAPSWDHASTGPAVDLSRPGQVVSVSVCHYEPSRSSDATPVLASSIRLTGVQADAAVTAIERSAAGALPAVPEDQCQREPERNPLWLHIAYAHADPVPVHVRYSTCEQRWTASPSGVSQVSQAQLQALLGPLHTGYGYPVPLPPH